MRSPTSGSPALSKAVLAALAIAGLGAAVYLNTLGGDFVWDDRILILEGQLPRAWERFGEIFTRDFFARSEFELVYGYYRPLTTLSYLLDYSWWHVQPWGYHLTNILLHAAASALVTWVLI